MERKTFEFVYYSIQYSLERQIEGMKAMVFFDLNWPVEKILIKNYISITSSLMYRNH